MGKKQLTGSLDGESEGKVEAGNMQSLDKETEWKNKLGRKPIGSFVVFTQVHHVNEYQDI